MQTSNIWRRTASGTGLAGLLILLAQTSSLAATYHVDCAAPLAGSGTEASPWNSTGQIESHGTFNAGDMIAFKRGTSCTLPGGPSNALTPDGSGTSGNPIVLGAYGSGAAPILNQNFNDDILHLHNQSHWTVQDLRLVGDGAGSGANGAASNGRQRRGIRVEATTASVAGITISNVEIANVIGQDAKFGGGSAGILFYNKDELGHLFSDIVVEDNTLTNVHRGGIEFASALQSEVTAANPPFTLNPAVKSTGVMIRGNTLSNIGGDGIVLDGTDGAIVEDNVLDGIALRSTANNVAMWPRNAINSLFQSNTISNTQQHPGTSDGQALDADWWGVNNVFQYNLSKDNQGGFALLCTNPASGLSAAEAAHLPAGVPRSVLRYNISINDGFNSEASFPDTGANARSWFTNCFLQPEGIEVYNNVFYAGYGGTVELIDGAYANALSGSRFDNNLFYGATGTTIDMQRSNTGVLDALTDFRNNMLTGTVTDAPAHASNLTSDPLLVGPLTEATGFKPQAGSPMVSSGMVISGNGGRDFEGTAVPAASAPYRGAFETTAVAVPVSGDHFGHATDATRRLAAVASTDGADVVLATSGTGSDQIWQLTDAGGGYHFIDNQSGAVRLHASAASGNDVNVVSDVWTGQNVQWQVTDAGSGKVFITHRATGMKLHASAAGGYVVDLTDPVWTGPNVQWNQTSAP